MCSVYGTVCHLDSFVFVKLAGDQLGELGEHYVLHSRCSFFLGLDVFCSINCGE